MAGVEGKRIKTPSTRFLPQPRRPGLLEKIHRFFVQYEDGDQ